MERNPEKELDNSPINKHFELPDCKKEKPEDLFKKQFKKPKS